MQALAAATFEARLRDPLLALKVQHRGHICRYRSELVRPGCSPRGIGFTPLWVQVAQHTDLIILPTLDLQVVHTLAKGSYHFFMTQASANQSVTLFVCQTCGI